MGKNEAILLARWSDLPKDLLRMVLSKMSFISCIRCKAVCSSWRAIVNLDTLWPLQKFPCLMLPPEKQDNNIRFFSPEDKKIYNLKNTPHGFKESLCLGSSHGWLVMFDKTLQPYIFNPFSPAKILLPPLETYSEILTVTKTDDEGGYDLVYIDGYCEVFRHINSVKDLRSIFLFKAILSSDPSRNENNVGVFMIFEFSDFEEAQLAFTRIGDNKWTLLGGKMQTHCDVIICDNNRLYTLSRTYMVDVWDIGCGFPVITTIIRATIPEELLQTFSLHRHLSSQSYLVESGGEILLVTRFIKYEDTRGCTTGFFKLFNLNFSLKKWVELKSLGDRTLFLGEKHSMSFSLQGYKANSIYFTDDCWCKISDRYVFGRPLDLGVFNLEDTGVEPFHEHGVEAAEPPPFWIIPSSW